MSGIRVAFNNLGPGGFAEICDEKKVMVVDGGMDWDGKMDD